MRSFGYVCCGEIRGGRVEVREFLLYYFRFFFSLRGFTIYDIISLLLVDGEIEV